MGNGCICSTPISCSDIPVDKIGTYKLKKQDSKDKNNNQVFQTSIITDLAQYFNESRQEILNSRRHNNNIVRKASLTVKKSKNPMHYSKTMRFKNDLSMLKTLIKTKSKEAELKIGLKRRNTIRNNSYNEVEIIKKLVQEVINEGTINNNKKELEEIKEEEAPKNKFYALSVIENVKNKIKENKENNKEMKEGSLINKEGSISNYVTNANNTSSNFMNISKHTYQEDFNDE